MLDSQTLFVKQEDAGGISRVPCGSRLCHHFRVLSESFYDQNRTSLLSAGCFCHRKFLLVYVFGKIFTLSFQCQLQDNWIFSFWIWTQIISICHFSFSKLHLLFVSDMQAYQIATATPTSLPQGVVMATTGSSLTSPQQLTEEAQRKRELRLLKNRYHAVFSWQNLVRKREIWLLILRYVRQFMTKTGHFSFNLCHLPSIADYNWPEKMWPYSLSSFCSFSLLPLC